MADIESTWPDNYVELNQLQTPSHYERKLDSFSTVWEKTWRVIIDTENNVATILVSGETKQETNELNEILNKTIIQKLVNTNNQEIIASIENWSLKTIEIPWKERLAISLNWTDIDYISKYNWEIIFNLKKFKGTEMVWDMINVNLKDKYWVVFESWSYYQEWKKISIYNETLLNWISEWVDIVLNFEKLLKEELEKREKETVQ